MGVVLRGVLGLWGVMSGYVLLYCTVLYCTVLCCLLGVGFGGKFE